MTDEAPTEDGSGVRASSDLKSRTASAAKWRMAHAVGRGVLEFGVGVVLARLLPPEDFGLLALALIVTGLARYASNLGVAPAVIQAKRLTKAHVRVAFTLSVALGALMTAAVYVSAPQFADVFENSRVPAVLRIVGWTFLVSGFGNTAGALLKRDLNFRAVFWVTLISYSFGYSAVAVSLAVLGFGVWSLAWGVLAQEALETLLLLCWVRHDVRPLASTSEIRDLMGFGVGFTLGGLAGYGAQVLDNFVIGRWLGSAALGLYGRAYGLMKMPADYLTNIIQNVLFPAFSEVQEEPDRLARAFLLAVQLVTLVAAPLLAGMAVAAPHMITGIYGENWAGAAVPLQVLCIAGWVRAVYPVAETVARASGKVYQVFWRAAIFAMMVLGLGILATRWGTVGVAVAVTVASMGMFLFLVQLALHILPVGWTEFFSVQRAGLFVAAEVATAAGIVRWQLEAQGFSSLTIFLAVLAACGLALVTGIRYLPSSIRPTRLFEELNQAAMDSPIPTAALTRFRRLLRVSV